MRSNLVLLAAAFVLSTATFACGETDTSGGNSLAGEESGEPAGEREADDRPTSGDDDSRAPSSTPSETNEDRNTPATGNKPSTNTPATNIATTCESAKDLGALSGDTGTGKVTYEGSCDEWVRVRVKESSTSWIATGQKVTVTLVPPPGAELELAAFVNKEADLFECSTASATSNSESDKTESVKLEWGEEFAGNNSDDSRTIAVHVKTKTGQCIDKSWVLLVQGNQ